MLMILLVLSDLALLWLSRLNKYIHIVAFQGLLLAVFAVVSPDHAITARLLAIAVTSVALKGIVFPFLLRRVIREAGVQREVEPFVGYNTSVLCGLAMLGISLWLGAKLQPIAGTQLPLLIPAALMTMFTGLFLVVARKKALTQCIGYIIMENGIYAFGLGAVGEIPALVELGMLLDAFVAVFVMGIAIYHINREFYHIDVAQLSALKG